MMITTTNRRSATTTRPPHRRHSRWRAQRGLSRVAVSSAENTLGHLVDIGQGGFQISLSQPMLPVASAELLLILDQYPDPPQMTAVKATPVWIDAGHATGLRCVGFSIDALQPKDKMGILLHIKTHRNDYAVVSADRQRPVRPRTQGTPSVVQPLPRALNHVPPVTVAVFGFSDRERHQLDKITTQSALRPYRSNHAAPTYQLQTPNAMAIADVVIVDVDDANAMNACSAYLMNKPLIRTIKMGNKWRNSADPYIIQRRFVPQRLLDALDRACDVFGSDGAG